MTTTRERREEYHNVVRTLSPSRPLSPGTHANQFDSNLGKNIESLKICKLFKIEADVSLKINLYNH